MTDGRYVYMRGPADRENRPLFEYTLMPTHMAHMFRVNELQDIELREPFSFSRGCRTMKIQARPMVNPYIYGSLLFDLKNDPGQEHPIKDKDIEKRMIGLMVDLMKKNDVPLEQYERLGLPLSGQAEEIHLSLTDKAVASEDRIGNTAIVFNNKGRHMYNVLLSYIPKSQQRQFVLGIEEIVNARGLNELDEDRVVEIFQNIIPNRQMGLLLWVAEIIKEKGKE